MGVSTYEAEVGRLTAICTDEENTPEHRINTTRRLLRFTEFSARSCRVGNRIAKKYLYDENVSTAVRKKAASLLAFTTEKKLDPVEEAKEAEAETAAAAIAANDPSLPGDFSTPYFSRLHEGIVDPEFEILAAQALAKYDTGQPTHEKREVDQKSWWERTPYYENARAEHHAALRAVVASRKGE